MIARFGATIAGFFVGLAAFAQETKPRLTIPAAKGDIIQHAAMSADGKWIATSGLGEKLPGGVTLWDAKGEEKRLLTQKTKYIDALAFSPDGKQVAALGRGNRPDGDPAGQNNRWETKITLWEVPSGKERFTVSLKRDANSLAFSPDGSMLATGGPGAIRLLDTSDGSEKMTLEGQMGMIVISPIFGPGGKRVAAAVASRAAIDADGGGVGFDAEIRIWSLATGKVELTCTPPKVKSMQVRSLAFNHNGELLASGDGGGRIRHWDTKTGTLKSFIKVPNRSTDVESLAFSPDGSILASADGLSSIADDDIFTEVRLWDLAGQEQAVFRGQKHVVHTIAFSKDGKSLMSAGRNGVQVWDVAGKK